MITSAAPSAMRAEQMALRATCAHPRGGWEPFDAGALDRSIPARFAEQVARHASRLAVKTSTVALTYAELNAAANRVAHALLARRGARAAPVGLLFGNGAAFVTASLGALKAGVIEVPLDREFPRDRLAYMVEHSGARVLLTDAAHLPLARELAGSRGDVVEIDRLECEPDGDPDVAVGPETLASINYTSGSTGRPKGIVHDHRAILANVRRHSNLVRLGAEDRQSFLRPAIVPPLLALLVGAATCPVDLDAHTMTGLGDWIIEQGVTVYRASVSGFRLLLDGLRGDERFPELRLAMVTGEPAYPADVERHRRAFAPECLFGTSLGTRESGDYAHFFAGPATAVPAGALPGGYATEGLEVHLLDDDGRPVPEGELGELAVRCDSAPVRYWERPDLTEAALRPDPAGGPGRVYRTGDLGRRRPDGCLLHLGRRDFQVKIRGHRVHVGDVEHALLDVPGVKEAVAAGRDEPGGGQRLVAYVVRDPVAPPDVSAIRRHLARALPEPMVPTAFVMLPELPRTATGKIDRRALPAPGRARPDLGAEPVAPRGPLETMLAEIWAGVLRLDAVGVHDAFVDLGGDSLKANEVVSQVLSRLPPALAQSVSRQSLFLVPTIAEMAAVILCAGADDRLARALANLEAPGEA